VVDYPVLSLGLTPVKAGKEEEEAKKETVTHTVTLLKGFKHKLQDGDFVELKSKSLSKLEGQEFKIVTLTPESYTIELPKGYEAPELEGDATMKQVKKPLTLQFKPYVQALRENMDQAPFDQDLSIYDFEKMSHQGYLHTIFAALEKFRSSTGGIPKGWDFGDSQKFLELA
jgi:hypothetical protein